MITLTEALTNRFPLGSAWVRRSLATMGGGIGPHLSVHDVAEGWWRPDASAEAVTTLFILAEDRLGLGHPDGEPARWVPISAITSLDVVDEPDEAVHAVVVGLAGGVRFTVGWPEWFSTLLVEVLSMAPVSVYDPAGSGPIDDGPSTTAMAPAPRGADALPAELDGRADVAPDPSALDGLGPSPWTESDVPDIGAVPAGVPTGVVADPVPPVASAPVAPAAVPVGDPVGLDEGFAHDHAGPAAADEPPTCDDERDPAASTVESAGEELDPDGPVPPWRMPGTVWPDPLRGVGYVGGHPDLPRKRKSGTMIFAPHGLVVSGSGFQSWQLHLEWSRIDRLTIQGADEVMFCDQVKIDPNSSAVCVDTVDGHRVFFEIRMRRPPSLRATLAPLLQMVESIGPWRVAAGLAVDEPV